MSIRWPDRFHPNRAPVHVKNEKTIDAPTEVVWVWLLQAERWPQWYPNSHDVQLEGGPGALAPRARFRWRTFGVSMRSEVLECESPSRLAWDARAFGVEAYHAWYIEPRGASSCHVLTEETQYGVLARLSARLFPRRMWEGHELWLERLAERARSGTPR